MATYRIPVDTSGGSSVVDTLFKAMQMRRQEEGAALHARQVEAQLAQNQMVMEEQRRALGEEAAARTAMPAALGYAAAPTPTVYAPGQAAVPAQFAEGPPEDATPLNMEPGTAGPSMVQTVAAQPAVAPRSVTEITEAGLMQSMGGPEPYARFAGTRTGQAFLQQHKPLTGPAFEKLVRVRKARDDFAAGLDEAAKIRENEFDEGALIRVKDAQMKALRALLPESETPEAIGREMDRLTQERLVLVREKVERERTLEDQKSIEPARVDFHLHPSLETWATLAGKYVNAKSKEYQKGAQHFFDKGDTKAFAIMERDAEGRKVAPFLKAVTDRAGQMGRSPGVQMGDNLLATAIQGVLKDASLNAADPATGQEAQAILGGYTELLTSIVSGKKTVPDFVVKAVVGEKVKPSQGIAALQAAVERVRTYIPDEKDPRYWPAVLKTAKEITEATRMFAPPHERLWESEHGRFRELRQLDHDADRRIKIAQAAIDKLNEGVIVRSQRSSPAHLAKLKPFEDDIDEAKRSKAAIAEEMTKLSPGIAPPAPEPRTGGRAATVAEVNQALKEAGKSGAEAWLRARGIDPTLRATP